MVDDTGRFIDEERDGPDAPRHAPLALIDGTPDDDTLDGTPEDDEINGFAGNDVISGGDGNDLIRGNQGQDTLRGNRGDDQLLGGKGADTIRGSGGNDEINGRGGDDDLSGGRGQDTILGFGRADVMSGDQGADTMDGGRGGDTMFGNGGLDDMFGGDGRDDMDGGGRSDTVDGGAGNDIVRGGRGADTLLGGGGVDELFGNAGDDIIDGGPALDTATGGGGIDTYRYSNVAHQMQITDFDPDNEILDFSDILNFTPGDGINNFVRFETNEFGTNVSVSPDGDGDFQLIAGLLGVNIDSLPRAQLGFPDGGGGGGGGGGTVTEPTVASANLAGTIGNGTSFLPSLSSDGQFVTFSSSSTNLAGADDNGATFDVFLKDLQTGDVTRISERNFPGAGTAGGDRGSFDSVVDDAGDTIVFASDADNFGGTDSAERDLYVSGVPAGNPELVSIPGNQAATQPSISADGDLVAFEAVATGLAGSDDPAPGTQNNRIFVRNLGTDELTDVSTAATGPQDFADAASFDPEIAANGGFVVFESDATNLLGEGNDTNGQRDVFRKNLANDAIDLVSSTDDGTQGFGGSTDASVSADGRFVAFQSSATFVAEDADDQSVDIYVKDMQTDAIQLVTINDAGIHANGESFTPSISDDGRFVAFRSEASNLVDGDDNGLPDVFVADLDNPGSFLRFDMEGDTSLAFEELVEPVLSGDGSLVAYLTDVTVGGGGGIDAAQVTVAPVDFGAAPAAVASVDQLITPADVV